MLRMDRRKFIFLGAQTAAVAAIAPKLWAQDYPSDLKKLYDKAIVIDSLCGPFANEEAAPTEAGMREVRSSGITAIHETVSAPTYEDTVKQLAALRKLVAEHPDLFLIVRVHSDIARAKREKKLGIMPGFQFTKFLEDDPRRITEFRKQDVRIMQLTYNLRGGFGDGCLAPDNGGLTKPGHAAVQQMNDVGVAVDMSHSGYRTTSDAIESSAKPVLITHSGCAAVYAHPRNKPDEVLKQLADRGGYIGIYLMPYLVASPNIPTRKDVLDHVMHAIKVCGEEHVGVGCDGSIEGVHMTPEMKKAFDDDIANRKRLGIGAPGEDRYPYVPDLSGPQHMETIAWELQKRGQSSAVIEKVLGENFHRVLGEIWGTA